MKKIKILICLLAIAGLQSCSNFLSEVPDNRTQLDTPEKISEILIYAYPDRGYMYFTEMMTDNVGDSKKLEYSDLDNTAYFKFEDFDRDEWDSPSKYWTSAYEAISQANQALEAIEKLGNPKSLDPQRGEALLARAYSHFMLLSIFSKPYNPDDADLDLGIPYMTGVEVKLLQDYERNTIAETIEFIEDDLLEGIKIVGNNYKLPKFHFTQSAAKAFAVKFYTYKAEWDKVLEYSDDLGDKPYGKLRNLNEYSTLSFAAQRNKYAGKEETTNLLISSGPSIHDRHTSQKRFGLTTKGVLTDQFLINNPFGKEWAYIFTGYSFGTSRPTKFNEYFKYSNAAAGIGYPNHSFVILSNDDMYLNRIEAVIMNNEFERAASMLAFFAMHKTKGSTEADLPMLNDNYITKVYGNASEYEPFYSLTPKQQIYIKAVAEYRRREFAWEGARFFDIKRFNLEVEHVLELENEVLKLEKRDLRKAIQLPSMVFQYGVEANER